MLGEIHTSDLFSLLDERKTGSFGLIAFLDALEAFGLIDLYYELFPRDEVWMTDSLTTFVEATLDKLMYFMK